MAEHDAERAQALADAMPERPRQARFDEPAVGEQAGVEGCGDVVLDAVASVSVSGERPLGEHGDVGNLVRRTDWAARRQR